jgi:hypothetical protein
MHDGQGGLFSIGKTRHWAIFKAYWQSIGHKKSDTTTLYHFLYKT